MKDSDTELGLLRSIKPEELELMLSWRNAPNVRNNMYTRHEISLPEHLAWWERMQIRKDQQYLMYEYQKTPSGIVAFNEIDMVNHYSSWAFYASPSAPKGTGSRMEYLALEHAFNNLRLNKLGAEVLAFNNPVIKLHQKFGFVVEGVLRQQHKLGDTFCDIYRIGILASEWMDRRDQMLQKLHSLSRP